MQKRTTPVRNTGARPRRWRADGKMPAMPTISVTTAAALAGVDRKTVRRWLGDGDVELSPLLERVGLDLNPDEIEAVLLADAQDIEGCADLAIVLSMRGLHARAVEWTQRAADRGHPDAMHWLARAYLDGRGVERDVNVGLMWLAKSASLGHPISAAQVAALLRMF